MTSMGMPRVLVTGALPWEIYAELGFGPQSDAAKVVRLGNTAHKWGMLDRIRVAEAKDYGDRAERLAEAGSGPVGRARGVDGRPAHLLG